MSFDRLLSQFDTLGVNSPVFFNMCDDLEEMRYFYTDILGIKENSYQRNNYLDYNSNGLTMMFFQADNITERIASSKRRYNNGHFELMCWTIKINKEMFIKAIENLSAYQNKGSKIIPQWQQEGFWSFSIKDPMGNTVFVYLEQKQTPVSKVWDDLCI